MAVLTLAPQRKSGRDSDASWDGTAATGTPEAPPVEADMDQRRRQWEAHLPSVSSSTGLTLEYTSHPPFLPLWPGMRLWH